MRCGWCCGGTARRSGTPSTGTRGTPTSRWTRPVWRRPSERTGIPVRHDRRLRERSGGEWEGLTNDDIREKYPEQWARWDAPGGETDVHVADRFAAAVTDGVGILPAGGTLVVASHGSAIRAGLGRLLGLPQESWRMLGPVQNCSWSVIAPAPDGWEYAGWRRLEHNAGTLPVPVLSDDR